MEEKTITLAHLYLGTADGLRAVRIATGDVVVEEAGVHGNAVRDIAVHPDDPDDVFVACGLRGWGLHHTSDGGDTFREVGFGDRWVWGVTRHPGDPERIYVGTEPPMLYRSMDNGATFEAFEGVEELPSRDRWTFFHEPFRAGHVHGIAIHPDRPEYLYAGIEHGALIYSPDNGETWRETLVDSDVHRIAIAPDDPTHLFAGTGNGLYESRDGGHGWDNTPDLGSLYIHSIQFDPFEPDRLVVYADEAGIPLYLSDDRGSNWTPIGQGLPAAGPVDNVRFHPGEAGCLVYAADDDDGSSLFVSTDLGESWKQITRVPEKVWRVEVWPEHTE